MTTVHKDMLIHAYKIHWDKFRYMLSVQIDMLTHTYTEPISLLIC